jgi:hypothetical protein
MIRQSCLKIFGLYVRMVGSIESDYLNGYLLQHCVNGDVVWLNTFFHNSIRRFVDNCARLRLTSIWIFNAHEAYLELGMYISCGWISSSSIPIRTHIIEQKYYNFLWGEGGSVFTFPFTNNANKQGTYIYDSESVAMIFLIRQVSPGRIWTGVVCSWGVWDTSAPRCIRKYVHNGKLLLVKLTHLF